MSDWIIKADMFGHYRLNKQAVIDAEKEGCKGMQSGIFFRAHEVDELIDFLEGFKAKQNSGN